MTIEPVNVITEAARLTELQKLVPLARVDDFAFMVFLCHGAVAWHKHEELDEMFFVQQGRVLLEVESGSLILDGNELAVVPRQLLHQCYSEDPSIVLLFERTSPLRVRNGHRRIFWDHQKPPFSKVDIHHLSQGLREPFVSMPVAQVNDCVVTLQLAHGSSEWELHPENQEMIFVQEGVLTLETGANDVVINHHEVVVIPRGQHHRVVASEPAIFMQFACQAVSQS